MKKASDMITNMNPFSRSDPSDQDDEPMQATGGNTYESPPYDNVSMREVLDPNNNNKSLSTCVFRNGPVSSGESKSRRTFTFSSTVNDDDYLNALLGSLPEPHRSRSRWRRTNNQQQRQEGIIREQQQQLDVSDDVFLSGSQQRQPSHGINTWEDWIERRFGKKRNSTRASGSDGDRSLIPPLPPIAQTSTRTKVEGDGGKAEGAQ